MTRLDFDKEENCFHCPVCGHEMTYLLDEEWECDYCGASGDAVNGDDGEPSYMDFDEEGYYERLQEDEEYDDAYFRDKQMMDEHDLHQR